MNAAVLSTIFLHLLKRSIASSDAAVKTATGLVFPVIGRDTLLASRWLSPVTMMIHGA